MAQSEVKRRLADASSAKNRMKIETRQRLARRYGKLEALTDAPKDFSAGDPAGVSFIKACRERRKLCFI